jgi:hypothetical protein
MSPDLLHSIPTDSYSAQIESRIIVDALSTMFFSRSCIPAGQHPQAPSGHQGTTN